MINIEEILKDAPCHCIIKIPDGFPKYKIGSDIDILCADPEDFVNHLTKFDTFIISRIDGHIHVDKFINKQLEVRFDLIGTLVYKKSKIDPNYSKWILENKEQNKEGFWVPAQIDDMITRLCEFRDFPHKMHHYNHFMSFLVKTATKQI